MDLASGILQTEIYARRPEFKDSCRISLGLSWYYLDGYSNLRKDAAIMYLTRQGFSLKEATAYLQLLTDEAIKEKRERGYSMHYNRKTHSWVAKLRKPLNIKPNEFAKGKKEVALAQHDLYGPPDRKTIEHIVKGIIKRNKLKGTSYEHFFYLWAFTAMLNKNAMCSNWKPRKVSRKEERLRVFRRAKAQAAALAKHEKESRRKVHSK